MNYKSYIQWSRSVVQCDSENIIEQNSENLSSLDQMEVHNLPYKVSSKPKETEVLASQKLKTFATIVDHRLDYSMPLQQSMHTSLSLKKHSFVDKRFEKDQILEEK